LTAAAVGAVGSDVCACEDDSAIFGESKV